MPVEEHRQREYRAYGAQNAPEFPCFRDHIETKKKRSFERPCKLLILNGGDDGTRTRGLCRDRAAF